MRVRAVTSTALGVDGGTLWVSAGEEFESDHPVVVAHPATFEPVEGDDEPKRRGRRNA